MPSTSDTLDSPRMRANRLKRVRNLANLDRDQMSESSDLNPTTLVSWENARFGGLSLKGAKRVVERVAREGVYCTAAWLMHGIGPEPSVNPNFLLNQSTSAEEIETSSEETLMGREVAFFKSQNPDAIDFIVTDESMLPQYQIGDYVAGKKRVGEKIFSTIGRDCIVQTAAGKLLFRHVRPGKSAGIYTLVCNNHNSNNLDFVISDIKLEFSAPVIWHRCKDQDSA